MLLNRSNLHWSSDCSNGWEFNTVAPPPYWLYKMAELLGKSGDAPFTFMFSMYCTVLSLPFLQ